MDGLGVFSWIIIGLIAGWIAEKVTGSRHGFLTNIAVGLVGAVVGGVLVNALQGARPLGFWPNLLVAAIGAVIFLFLWGLIRGRR